MTTTRDVLEALGDAGATASGAEWWGELDSAIDEVVVTWSASAYALRSVVPGDRTVLISRVHPYFAPPSGFDPAIVRPDSTWAERMRADPVASAKRRLVEESGAILVVAPQAWDLTGPDHRSRALSTALSLGKPRTSGEPTAVAIDLDEPRTAGALARTAADRVGGPRAYLTGDAAQLVRRTAVIAGLASPAQIRRVLKDPLIDAIITGEVVEWEGAPFVQDANSAGRRVALIALGNAVSEGPGTRSLADLLADRLPQTGVRSSNTPEASWTPSERRTA